MLSRVRGRRDEGFTLVELLIAILIMGTAVSVLVVAMGSLTVASQQQKGSAIAETATHNLAESIQNKVSYTTTLSADLSASATPTSIGVAAAAGFKTTPTASAPMDILIDQEVFTVQSISGNTLTLATDSNHGRGEAGSAAAAHSSGASVIQYFVCPTAQSSTASDGHVGYLTPDGFQQPTDTATPPNVLATATVQEVDYLQAIGSNSFTTSAATCVSNFATTCPDGDLLPQCDPGVERVDIRTQTALANLQNVTTDGWILVRRGSN